MGVFQTKVSPLPTDIDLTGKTVIITGASAGLGLESARQVLALKASTVILAVRNITKGEECRASLLANADSNSIVKVLKLDMDDYSSVQSFAAVVKAQIPIVDFLLLNAGIGILNRENSASGHERTTQVNYLSNVLLILELLPHLEASAITTGSPARITWVGSRMHAKSTLSEKAKAVKPEETVIGHMDDPRYFFPFQRYNDIKLLCVMFLYQLAPRLDRNKVVINMLCPGMVDTAMSDVLPIYLRVVANLVKAIRARSVEQGAWLILNAMCVVGSESHGEFLADKVIQP